MPDENIFGVKLKKLRKKAGLTQEQLAELIPVSIPTLKRWEKGYRSPKINDIKNLCKIFNCTEKDLLSDDNSSNDEWVVEVKFADTKKEVFNLAQGMPCISEFLTSQYGVDLHIAGVYEIFQNDNKFKSLLKQIKEARKLVLLNGKAIGAIKDKN